MDTPPLRLQVAGFKDISSKKAQARLDGFLAAFRDRCTPSQGGDTAVIVQLQKLANALHQERARIKR
jgi:hypothetical protein